jgi:hypothetical protein
MKIRIIKAWGLSRVNDVIDPPAPVAIELIKAGRAVVVEDRTRQSTPTTETWNKSVTPPQRGRRANGKLQ